MALDPCISTAWLLRLAVSHSLLVYGWQTLNRTLMLQQMPSVAGKHHVATYGCPVPLLCSYKWSLSVDRSIFLLAGAGPVRCSCSSC